MFKRGSKDHQLSFDDRLLNLPKSVVDHLRRSWAESFYRDVFTAIQEERFAVLFSTNYSRPNKPVNIMVSLLLLKELHQQTDEEIVGSVYFDYRYQYALGISNVDKESVSINTLTNFRQRLLRYEQETGIDLLKEEIDALSNRLADLIRLDRSLARMDSLMVSSSCKRLTRMELAFRVVQQAVKALDRQWPEHTPEPFRVYLDADHKTDVLYRTRHEASGGKLAFLLAQARDLLDHILALPDIAHSDVPAFGHLTRLLKEQCAQTEDGEWVTLDETSSASMQNPSDPDATYRNKGGRGHIGYSMNVVEVRDPEKNVGLILEHEVQPNIHSDAAFGQTFVESHPLAEELDTLVMDGAYYRRETMDAAVESDTQVVFTDMSGRKPVKDKLSFDAFEANEKEGVTLCPGGKKPVTSRYDKKKNVYTAKFNKLECAQCPLQSQCPFMDQKKFNTVRFTKAQRMNAIHRSLMIRNADEHRALSKFRAGVEGVMSVMRRRFRIDELPVRGLARAKMWMHAKIGAYNIRMVWKHQAKTV